MSGGSSVGGLVGYNSNTITNGYWNTETSGMATGVGAGSATGVTGLTTATLAGALPSGFATADWANACGQITPYLLANTSFSTVSGSVNLGTAGATPVAYQVIATPTQLQNINTTGLGGAYVLGSDMNLVSIANFTPIGSNPTSFTGTFNGLDHTISNLSITGNSADFVGLFGYAIGATISNVGLVGGSVSGHEHVGELIGNASNLSPSVVSRLTAGWQGEYDAWTRRDLSARNYVYIWADGVYLQARMEENAECMLVTSRRTHGVDGRSLHLVSAWASRQRLVLGQERCA